MSGIKVKRERDSPQYFKRENVPLLQQLTARGTFYSFPTMSHASSIPVFGTAYVNAYDSYNQLTTTDILFATVRYSGKANVYLRRTLPAASGNLPLTEFTCGSAIIVLSGSLWCYLQTAYESPSLTTGANQYIILAQNTRVFSDSTATTSALLSGTLYAGVVPFLRPDVSDLTQYFVDKDDVILNHSTKSGVRLVSPPPGPIRPVPPNVAFPTTSNTSVGFSLTTGTGATDGVFLTPLTQLQFFLLSGNPVPVGTKTVTGQLYYIPFLSMENAVPIITVSYNMLTGTPGTMTFSSCFVSVTNTNPSSYTQTNQPSISFPIAGASRSAITFLAPGAMSAETFCGFVVSLVATGNAVCEVNVSINYSAHVEQNERAIVIANGVRIGQIVTCSTEWVAQVYPSEQTATFVPRILPFDTHYWNDVIIAFMNKRIKRVYKEDEWVELVRSLE